jgi:hypothetical protein
VRTAVRPGDEVILAVGGDRNMELDIRCRRDCDPGGVEHCPLVVDARAVDVTAAGGAIVSPGNEVGIRTARNDRAAFVSRRVGRNRKALRIEDGAVGVHSGAEDIGAREVGCVHPYNE